MGNIEIDPGTSTVRRSGRELALQPKVFGVLRYLLENRNRVISKDELLGAVWQGESVHESTVPWSISHVRDALGQRRGSRLPIETVHRRGYRFAAEVEVLTSMSRVRAGTETSPGVLEALAAPGACAPMPRDPRPYVGQDALIEQLMAYVDGARSGRGGLCVLAGETGIGKSRTAEELAVRARARGVTTVFGRCLTEAGGPSYWPFIQVLRELARVPELAVSAERLLARLEQPPSAADSQDSQDAQAEGFWIADELARFLTGPATEHGPLCLILDDLQLADPASLRLLRLLAPGLCSKRVLVLATLGSPTTDTASQLLARLLASADRLEVPAMGIQDVAEFIARVAGLADAPEPLACAVHACTAGVPLFVQDCVRELIRRHGATALYGLDPAAARLPDSARAVLHARLSALAPGSLSLLAAASVLGTSFELPLLAAITDRRPASLLPPLQAAERAGFLAGDSPQRFRFTLPLAQALLYDELPGAERVQLHQRAAEALEQSPSLPPRSAEIALHYYRALPAGTHLRAAAAAREAARAAESVLDYARAAHYYEWVLEAEPLSRSHEPRAYAELLLSAGKAQRLAGRTRKSRATLERLFELAREQRFTDLLLRGARVLRPSVAVSVMPDALVRSALEDVLTLAPLDQSELGRTHRALALSQLACVPPISFDLVRCKQLSEEALHLARQLGQVPVLLEALRARLYALSGPDDGELLLLTAAEILELDRPQPSIMTLEAHGARCGAYTYRGELAAADKALAALGRAAHEQNLLEGIWYYDRQRAQRLLMQGDYAGASAAIRELHGRSQQLGLGYGRDFLAPLERRLRHDLHRAEAALNESRLAQGLYDVIPYMRAQRARFAAERGELAAARSSVDWLAAQGFENLPREVSYLNTLANLAIAVIHLGDLERAEQLYTLLSPYALMSTPDGYLCDEGAVSRYLALLAAMLGWHERVEAHFRSALVVNRDMGRRPELARTYYDYAVWVSNQDQHGASAQAQELAREASLLADSLGMRWLSQLARELMT